MVELGEMSWKDETDSRNEKYRGWWRGQKVKWCPKLVQNSSGTGWNSCMSLYILGGFSRGDRSDPFHLTSVSGKLLLNGRKAEAYIASVTNEFMSRRQKWQV